MYTPNVRVRNSSPQTGRNRPSCSGQYDIVMTTCDCGPRATHWRARASRRSTRSKNADSCQTNSAPGRFS